MKEIHTDFRFIELLTNYYVPFEVDDSEVSIIDDDKLRKKYNGLHDIRINHTIDKTMVTHMK